ncbi:hypothetical protein P154DRAFT_526254 [Amniculicola lignicola CBS 123094]|uniref:Integral membrane protein n=1 Tax=Amniculicola lignicola CBS 123094 TaxID=1392246 RepID=A0A6A5W1H4_9PLEO|nr:hypothetical protein P154DRAFT_526254 [Amniculicola lignicola CBS 123094]
MTLRSIQSRTYSMPLFSLALNFSWEAIFSLYVAETLFEKTAFAIWMLLDLGLIYTTVTYGAHEWPHAPVVGRHIGKIWAVACAWSCLFLWCGCRWWLGLGGTGTGGAVSPKEGKVYRGVEGPDSTELGYWSVVVIQNVLSGSLVAQLVVRGSSRGSGYGIWAARFGASLVGLNGYFGYVWWVWPEAHGYVVGDLSVCLGGTWVVLDLVYLAVLREVKKGERKKSESEKSERKKVR